MWIKIQFSPPCENTLLVSRHPARLLLRHKVGKVPNHLPDEPALCPSVVKCAEVLPHEVGLELLREADRGEGVEAVFFFLSVFSSFLSVFPLVSVFIFFICFYLLPD